MATNSNIRAGRLMIVAALMALLIAPSAARGQLSSRDVQALSGAELIYVATVRKSGAQSKSAPVWFTTSADGNSLLIQTRRTTWKAKRIKRGSPVLVWIGSATGPAFMGKAAISNDAAVQAKILKDYKEKYWQNRVLGIGPSRGEFDSGEVVAIAITPVRDLPNGFTSAPGSPPPALQTPAH